MPVRIRPADLSQDRSQMIDLFRRELTPASTEQRFDWLYCKAPHGAARAWIAYDTADNGLIGAAAAFPRKMSFGGREECGWVLGDFCVDKNYRTLGPALQLQRACIEAVGNAPGAFCYDFPSQGMMAVYKRLGVSQAGSLVRWAKPVRATKRIERVVRSKTLARTIGLVVDAGLAQHGWKGHAKTANLALHTSRCGDEFSSLDREVRSGSGAFTIRTAEYLNWRFLDHPSDKHEILTARLRDSLIGYLVLAQLGEEGRILDICCLGEPSLVASLLARAVQELKQKGVTSVSMNAGGTHPWNGIFERAGFRRRQESPVVVCAPEGGTPWAKDATQPWYLMQGERDS